MLQGSSYLYLTSWNLGKGEITFAEIGKPGLREHRKIEDVPGLKSAITNGNRIYANGGSAVFITR